MQDLAVDGGPGTALGAQGAPVHGRRVERALVDRAEGGKGPSVVPLIAAPSVAHALASMMVLVVTARDGLVASRHDATSAAAGTSMTSASRSRVSALTSQSGAGWPAAVPKQP